MNRHAPAAIIIVLLASACAVRKPPFHTYRFVARNSNQVLIPPGVTRPDVPQRTFWVDLAARRSLCRAASGVIGLQIRKKRILVTVNREALVQQPPGWLSDRAAEFESEGCLAPGSGTELATRTVESLPLDPRVAFRLLYSSQLHVSPQIRLQVISPILRPGAAPYTPTLQPAETAGTGTNVTVVVKSTADVIGYETAWYAVHPKANGVGSTIAPLYAERHAQGESERRPQPAIDHLRFPPETGFYRLFQKAEGTEFTQLLIGARTPAELEERAKTLETGTASCERLNGEMCIPIPRAVAINLFLPITVNGTEVMVRWGTDVGEAIRAAGVRQPRSVLQNLAVSKPYQGRPVTVDFDRTSPVIFNLTLTGGENISWR